MASKPKKTVTTTVTRPTAGGGTKTVRVSKTTQGGNTTISRTTTITRPKKAATKTGAPGSKPAPKPKGKSPTPPAKYAAPALGGTWIAGPNDGGRWQLCGPVALANHLLAATGTRAGNRDIERLYAAAGGHGDSGAQIEALLAAAECEGLAGHRLAAYARVAADEAADGLLLLLSLGWTPDWHAAPAVGGALITWGEAVPAGALPVQIEDAWSLTWHGEAA